MPKPKPRYVLTEQGLTKVKNKFCEICGTESPSQQAMAEAVGVHRNTIANLLNRTQGVNRDTLDKLCSSLGWDWDFEIKEGVDYKLWEQPVSDTKQETETILCKNYKIIKLLSTGEFSNTYLTEYLDLPNNPQRIVKQLNSNCSDEARGLFTREARVLSQLNRHPQIPTLFDYFEEDGDFYLVHEYIEGHSLSEELIEGKPWNESQVIDLLNEILDILVFVQKFNIIHRDINPENLIRRQIDNKIVLINFAAVKEISTELTDRTYRGTKRDYMASEQQKGIPQLCSDIYGVGIVAIQALTGLHPKKFPVDYNTGNIVWRNNAQVSQNFADILDQMVCFYFQNRYQSAAEALRALQSL